MDTMKCPVCGKSISLTFSDSEIAQGGKNVVCPQCKKVLWVSTDGKIKSIPTLEDWEKERCVITSCSKETPYNKNTPIDQRKHYVRGAGQLCKECHELYYRPDESE